MKCWHQSSSMPVQLYIRLPGTATWQGYSSIFSLVHVAPKVTCRINFGMTALAWFLETETPKDVVGTCILDSKVFNSPTLILFPSARNLIKPLTALRNTCDCDMHSLGKCERLALRLNGHSHDYVKLDQCQ